MHTLRKAYQWSDKYIFDVVEDRGIDWITEQYRYIKEDELQKWTIMMNIVPFARTPLTKKGGKAMVEAERNFGQALMKAITPWKNAHEERKKRFERKYGVKPGEIAIVYGAGESNIAKSLANKDTKLIKGK